MHLQGRRKHFLPYITTTLLSVRMGREDQLILKQWDKYRTEKDNLI